MEALNKELLDKNEQISAEQAKQLGHFACMSHEIRTPLAVIRSSIDNLEHTHDGLDPEQRAVAPRALQYLEVVVSWPGPSAPRNLNLLTVVPLREPAE